MSNFGAFLPFVFALIWIAVVVYLVVLFTRLVTAHERVANALEKIANKQQDSGKL